MPAARDCCKPAARQITHTDYVLQYLQALCIVHHGLLLIAVMAGEYRVLLHDGQCYLVSIIMWTLSAHVGCWLRDEGPWDQIWIASPGERHHLFI